MTHAELVDVAVRWLKNTKRCGVVLREHHGGTTEIPDAQGWRAWHSILVECKVSRADFLADRKKASRLAVHTRPAEECWYLTERGLVLPRELPVGWGLIEYYGTQVRQVVPVIPANLPKRSELSVRNELMRLYCEVRRYQAQGLKYLTVKELDAQKLAERQRRMAQERNNAIDYPD